MSRALSFGARGLPAISALSLLLASQAGAAIFWSTSAADYSVSPGGTVSVEVYLTFTDDDAVTLTNDLGLSSLGVGASVVSSTPNSTPAAVLAESDILPNTADFNDFLGPVKILNAPSFAGFLALVDIAEPAGVIGDLIDGGAYRIHAGSFVFTAGASFDEVTTVEVGDLDDTTSDTVSFALSVFDDDIDSTRFTITTVPSAGATALAAVAVGLVSLRRRR